MLNFLPAPLLGVLSALLLVINTLLVGALILALALLKFLLPLNVVRRPIDWVLNTLGQRWVRNNSLWMALAGRTQWRVEGLSQLKPRGWYLVTANHQSWVDILVLQKVFVGRIPFLKFFLKQQLIYVPVIGLVWWAMDFPFMRRHSPSYLKKHPEKRGQDQEATRRACEKFSLVPTSVINFIEGTRFTPAKQARQASPYRHLLKPKAGGLALAINAMGDKFHSLLDVTIHYPAGAPTFWDLLCGKVGEIVVLVNEREIPHALIHGDYSNDQETRIRMQAWLNEIWQAKDEQLAALKQGRA